MVYHKRLPIVRQVVILTFIACLALDKQRTILGKRKGA